MPRKFLPLPPLETLQQLFVYDESLPSSLRWRKDESQAGRIKTNGYWYVSIKRQYYLCHRIAYYLKTGINPGNNFVDHADRNPAVNSNLRLASQVQNTANTGKMKDRKYTSRYKGVSWHPTGKKWVAQIYSQGKSTYLGSFNCEHEAAIAYNNAAIAEWGEFAYVNEIEAS